MLSPVTPEAPKKANSQPPTTAPTIPRTMSRTTPSPLLFTILLAIKPAMRPKMIQAMIDISATLCDYRTNGVPTRREFALSHFPGPLKPNGDTPFHPGCRQLSESRPRDPARSLPWRRGLRLVFRHTAHQQYPFVTRP